MFFMYGWEAISRAWTFMTDSLTMCFRDKDLLIPSVLGIMVGLAFVGAVMGVAWSAGLFEHLGEPSVSAPRAADEVERPPAAERPGGEADRENKIGLAVVGVVLTFGIYLIFYFFNGMTVNLVDTYLRGEDARLGEAFGDALKNIMGIVALAMVSALISIATRAARRRARESGGAAAVVGSLLADLVQRLWTVASFLLLPIIIIEDVGLGTALSRARSMHSRNLLDIAVGEIGVGFVSGLIGFLGLFVGASLAGGAYWLSPALLVPGIAVGAVVFTLAMAFTMYFRTTYYTCLYLWAAQAEAAGHRVTAPAPIQAALAS